MRSRAWQGGLNTFGWPLSARTCSPQWEKVGRGKKAQIPMVPGALGPGEPCAAASATDAGVSNPVSLGADGFKHRVFRLKDCLGRKKTKQNKKRNKTASCSDNGKQVHKIR